MRSAAIILSMCLLSAAPPSESAPAPAAAAATPQVVMVSAEYADVPEFDVTGPTEVKAGASFILKADVPKGVNANAVRWVIDPPPPVYDFDRSFDGAYKLTVLDPPKGRYVTTLVGATLVDGDPVPLLTVWTVTAGDGKPDPVDPDDDDTDPDDDDPEPTPDTAPFPADGLHVLIVYESEHDARLTDDQRAIVASVDVRAFLNSVAPNRYRIYDKDADLQFVSQVWKDAMAVPRQSLPWLVVSNGKTGFSGPLDMTPDAFKTLVGKHK